MDYKKKYEEALEKGREFYNRLGNKQLKEEVESIFPELVVSEDERIRQYLIDMLKNDEKCYLKELAWLEKQGEQKHQYISRPKYIGEEELLGEQKPADKVETKFHEGDWVILTAGELSTTLQIVKVDTNKKLYWFNDSSYLPIVDEECLHFWTIQDAKDGDILCDYLEAYDNPLIFILKKFERVDFGLVKPSDYSSYCFLTAGDRQIFKGGEYHHKHNIKPATKEQRDTLMKATADAGYTFDFESKELKKIEQKPDWSEEDIVALDCAIDFLKKEGLTSLAASIERLKFLRPQSHWRPSESQIDLINEAIGFFGAHSAKGLLMIELRNNIKKLTE